MCLSTLWNEENTKAYLKHRPETITVYKAMRQDCDGFKSEFRHGEQEEWIKFHPGINYANTTDRLDPFMYQAGFHCFTNKRDAIFYTNGCKLYGEKYCYLVPCTVRKEWITNIGLQSVWRNNHRRTATCIVASQITCLDYIGDEK